MRGLILMRNCESDMTENVGISGSYLHACRFILARLQVRICTLASVHSHPCKFVLARLQPVRTHKLASLYSLACKFIFARLQVYTRTLASLYSLACKFILARLQVFISQACKFVLVRDLKCWNPSAPFCLSLSEVWPLSLLRVLTDVEGCELEI